ncbi:MAG: hypothetical protein JJT89_12105 [Nitriliruptoraceae bacterium]|nr:hypothetical protein [Nitriliruptoraceae bacterium]
MTADPVVLQTGPEHFQVLLGDGIVREANLAAHTRRALGPGRTPLEVATTIVHLAREQGTWPREQAGPIDLGRLAGTTPTGIEELRHRLG